MRVHAGLGCFVLTASLLLIATGSAHAGAALLNGFGGAAGYGPSTQCLSPNDDGSSAQISLSAAFPGGLHFFSATHTNAYVNTNGNITFSGSVSQYTPNAFPVANQPMIAPYWGDADIRMLTSGVCTGSSGLTCSICAPCENPTENGVWWYLEPGRMVVTWDRVGYFNCHNDKRMSFQLILTTPGCAAPGDFEVEFRYNRCEWETGDASGGSGGFGGTPAQAGFDAGDQVHYVALPGSMASGIANRLCTSSNSDAPGVWRFHIRSGEVVCPNAGEACRTGALGVCNLGHLNCVGMQSQCVQDLQPSAEVCDGLDNNCDGRVDEEDVTPLCPANQVCDRGFCVSRCTQGTCPAGQTCTPGGACTEEACVNVNCPSGQRCIGGYCMDPCHGVVCPPGRTCLAGACTDLCEGRICDACSVCEEGGCAARCDVVPCEDGKVCQFDGHCVDQLCAFVTCNIGMHCSAGACVDDCAGVVCPFGQSCTSGECWHCHEASHCGFDCQPCLTNAGTAANVCTGGGGPASTTCSPTCARGFADVDGDRANGCEAACDQPANCGRDCKSCETNEGTSANACSGNSGGDASDNCSPTCASGFVDVDGNKANGCEAPCDQPEYCGMDCLPCQTNDQTIRNTCTGNRGGNASAKCSPTCASGFIDLDGDKANGCEAICDAVDHCGTDCMTCRLTPNSERTCTGSTTASAEACQYTCREGYADRDQFRGNGCEACAPGFVRGAQGACVPGADEAAPAATAPHGCGCSARSGASPIALGFLGLWALARRRRHFIGNE